MLAVAAFALAACGDDSKSVSTDQRVESSSTTTSTSAPPSTSAPATSEPATTSAPTTPPTDPPTSTTDAPPPTTHKPGKPTRRNVVFTPPGAQPRKATLVTPQPDHLNTLVVLVHGGNGTNGTRNQLREWQDYYASQGYSSMSIDYSLVKKGMPPPVFDKPQQDVVAAVQYAVTNAATLGIDPARVVVQGFTEGAGLGAQDLLAQASAGAAFVGVEGTYDGTQENPEQYYGGPPDSPDPDVQARYAQANSIERAADANGPSLLFAAGSGPAELVAQAQAFNDALDGAGRSSRVEIVPGAGGDFESGGRELTPDGKVVADAVLAWLNELFPS